MNYLVNRLSFIKNLHLEIMTSKSKNRPQQRPEDPKKHNAQQEREYREQKAGKNNKPDEEDQTEQNATEKFSEIEKKQNKEEE